MANILFYSPFNQRSRDTESLMLAFHRVGHKVISLSQQEGHVINDFLNANGISAFSKIIPGKRSGLWYFLRHLIFFIGFCWNRQIDIVYSHLEPSNFVAAIAQYLIRARVYLCRHHIDEGLLYQFDRSLYYKVTYLLAKKIIVVSKHAQKYMIEQEGIPAKKIIHINLAYDFDLYGKPDNHKVNQIRKEFNSDVLLISVCRLTAFKRPELTIQVVRYLAKQDIDVKLIMLGIGEMHDQLKKEVIDLGLEKNIFMVGYVNNVLDYMAAADFLIHPSLLDSSCVAVKEAGLVKLPAIVCQGIGDFNDYIVDKKNGFSVNPDTFVNDASKIILENYLRKDFLQNIGQNLNQSILDLFHIRNVVHKYDLLNTSSQ